MIMQAANPEGDYQVAPCQVEVEERLYAIIFILLIIVLIPLAYFGIDLLIFLTGFLIGFYFWLRGRRNQPDAVVLHGDTVSVIEGVVFNKKDHVFKYENVYHFQKESLGKNWFPSFYPAFRFKDKNDGTVASLRSSRSTRKQKIYQTNVIGLDEMERILFQESD